MGGAGTNVVNGYGPQAMLSAGVNALTSTTEGTAPATRFRYDAAGNQTDVFHHRAPSSPTDVGDKRLTWTHFNLPREVVDGITGSGTTTFRYDAGHQRVLETRGSTVRVTLGGVFEERDLGGVGQQQVRTHNVFAAGRLVAQLTQTAAFGQWSSTVTANYVHQDALGSPDAVTGGAPGSPVLVERAKYEPFGEKRNPDDVFLAATPQAHTRNVGFTGHQPDDAFGLTNMKGRLYDQRTGRFVSADPVVSAPGFGQAFNRYAYVHNDPVHFVDPSGFFPVAEALFVIALSLPFWVKLGVGLLALAGTIYGAVSSFIPLAGSSSPSPSTPSGAPTGSDAGRADDSTGKPASDAPRSTGSPPPASDAPRATGSPPPTKQTTWAKPVDSSCWEQSCVKVHDGLPVTFFFQNSERGWSDWTRASHALDAALKSDKLNPSLNLMRTHGINWKVKISGVDSMKYANGRARVSASGRTFFIDLDPSSSNTNSVVGLEGRTVEVPASFEKTFLHEIGHTVGHFEGRSLDSVDAEDKHRNGRRALDWSLEGYRLLNIELTPLQLKALKSGNHVDGPAE